MKFNWNCYGKRCIQAYVSWFLINKSNKNKNIRNAIRRRRNIKFYYTIIVRFEVYKNFCCLHFMTCSLKWWWWWWCHCHHRITLLLRCITFYCWMRAYVCISNIQLCTYILIGSIIGVVGNGVGIGIGSSGFTTAGCCWGMRWGRWRWLWNWGARSIA